MAEHPCTEERFLNDVREHKMTIIKEDGVYRHLRFGRKSDSCYHFHIHTYPGGLLYTGDMGTYVFQRSEDMFEFFRTDRKHLTQRGKKLGINLGYWTEKLVAIDGNRGGGKVKAFDEEKFKKVVNEYRLGWIREGHGTSFLNKEQRKELWEAVEDEVISAMEDGEHYAYQAAHEFSWKHPEVDTYYRFEEFWDHDLTEYSHSIVWCMYALAWAVQQFDDFKAKQEKLASITVYDLLNRRKEGAVMPEGLTMEDLDAEAARRNMKCACCDTIENLHLDLGSGGPYRCNSTDCMVF